MFIKNLIYRFLRHRHFWRHVSFNELAELYISSMLRGIGLSIIGIFVPIYLYKLGYGVDIILLFFAGLFLVRIFADIIAAYCVARIGPKHTMLIGNILMVFTLAQLLALSYYDWPLWLIAVCFAFASAMYFLAYHVDFSKILHTDHGGKELGFMAIVEHIGGVFGPLAGGVIATLFGAEYTILIALALLIFATVPLFFSAEPTKGHQQLDFRFLDYSKLKWDFISWTGACLEDNLKSILWPLYIAITIFTVNTYAGIGLVTSAATIAAIVAAKLIGSVVDRNKGGALLHYSVWGVVAVNFTRPFVGGYIGATASNIINEIVATGYRIPYFKGMYDRADTLPGHRIAYVAVMEVVGDIAKTLVIFCLWAISIYVGGVIALQIAFVIAGLASLLIATERFPALK